MLWVVSVVMGESGKSEDEVMQMRLRKVFAYEHCWYAKQGTACRLASSGDSLENLLFLR